MDNVVNHSGGSILSIFGSVIFGVVAIDDSEKNRA